MFQPFIFKELICKAGLSEQKAADALDISKSALKLYITEDENRRIVPPLKVIERIADYFAVPVDLLLGRCTFQQKDAILSDYPKYFMELRRAPYEKYLTGKSPIAKDVIKADFETPYPFNIFDAINEAPINWVPGEKNLKGLKWALTTINPDLARCIIYYYQEGKTYEEIGQIMGYSKQFVQTLTAKGIRQLRHPSRKEIVMKGWHSQEEIDEYAEKMLGELNREKEKLKAKAAWIEQKEAIIKCYLRSMQNYGISEEEVEKLLSVESGENPINAQRIDMLNLSKRSINCLLQNGYQTVEDMIQGLTQNPLKFIKMRNLGKKSYEEILHCLDNLYKTDRFSTDFEMSFILK